MKTTQAENNMIWESYSGHPNDRVNMIPPDDPLDSDSIEANSRDPYRFRDMQEYGSHRDVLKQFTNEVTQEFNSNHEKRGYNMAVAKLIDRLKTKPRTINRKEIMDILHNLRLQERHVEYVWDHIPKSDYLHFPVEYTQDYPKDTDHKSHMIFPSNYSVPEA